MTDLSDPGPDPDDLDDEYLDYPTGGPWTPPPVTRSQRAGAAATQTFAVLGVIGVALALGATLGLTIWGGMSAAERTITASPSTVKPGRPAKPVAPQTPRPSSSVSSPDVPSGGSPEGMPQLMPVMAGSVWFHIPRDFPDTPADGTAYEYALNPEAIAGGKEALEGLFSVDLVSDGNGGWTTPPTSTTEYASISGFDQGWWSYSNPSLVTPISVCAVSGTATASPGVSGGEQTADAIGPDTSVSVEEAPAMSNPDPEPSSTAGLTTSGSGCDVPPSVDVLPYPEEQASNASLRLAEQIAPGMTLSVTDVSGGQFTTVTLMPVVGGVETGGPWVFQFTADGDLVSGSGTLATVEPVAEYATVGAATAIARANTAPWNTLVQQQWPGGIMPLGAAEGTTRMLGAPTTVSPSGTASDGIQDAQPASEGYTEFVPGEPIPMPVDSAAIVDATPSLYPYAFGGSSVLLPAWKVTGADDRSWLVLAVADDDVFFQ